ncbi:MAG: phosphatidate cytidylyltransferase [Desulfobacteraceae bacterium]|jgi:phosphatidate cytidylyltransferase
MHWKRWITALIVIPPILLIILKSSPLVFALALILVAFLGLWEYFRIVYADLEKNMLPLIQAAGYGCGALVMLSIHYRSFNALMLTLALNLITVAIFSILRFRTHPDAPQAVTKQIFGIIYIPVFLSFLILIRDGVNGPIWIVFILWVVAWGDTGALYTGTLWGRRKLCPAVSPKKTVEGALGGLAANLISGWLFKLIFFSAMPGMACVMVSLAAGAAGQAGDLFESEFKRAAGVKDSGKILPGHGGILDRIDALLFAAPVAYLLKVLLLP